MQLNNLADLPSAEEKITRAGINIPAEAATFHAALPPRTKPRTACPAPAPDYLVDGTPIDEQPANPSAAFIKKGVASLGALPHRIWIRIALLLAFIGRNAKALDQWLVNSGPAGYVAALTGLIVITAATSGGAAPLALGYGLWVFSRREDRLRAAAKPTIIVEATGPGKQAVGA